MSLILKSDKFSGNAISTVLESVIPKDYFLSANFTTNTYTKNGAAISAAAMVTVTRVAGAGYLDSQGEYQVATANSLRLHSDPFAGKGLLIEPPRANQLPEPNNPATGIYLVSSTVFQFLLFQIWGTGSVRFKSALFDYTVTKDTPQAFYNNISNQSLSIEVTVTGQVEYYIATNSPTKSVAVSKLSTSINEFAYFLIPPENKSWSVAISRKALKQASNLSPPSTFNFMQLLGKDTGAVSLFDQAAEDKTSQKEVKISTDVAFIKKMSASIFRAIEDNERVVISLDIPTATLKIAAGGVVSTATLPPNTISVQGINRIVLGNPAATSGSNSSLAQLFKGVYYYTRILTDDEMIAATA